MRRDADYLLDILQAARLALGFVSGKTSQEFCADVQCHFAAVRAVEVIGEAANRVSDTTRQQHPELPWRQMISMRNRLIHGYDELDLALVWDTIHNDIPPLIALLEPLVPGEE
jgi:uncharacterized protein with HEPN domain